MNDQTAEEQTLIDRTVADDRNRADESTRETIGDSGVPCPGCGHTCVLVLCTADGCCHMVVVCWGCHEVVDRYLTTGGRCEWCR